MNDAHAPPVALTLCRGAFVVGANTIRLSRFHVPPPAGADITQLDCRTAVDVDRFQLALGKEADEAVVGGPERKCPTLATAERSSDVTPANESTKAGRE